MLRSTPLAACLLLGLSGQLFAQDNIVDINQTGERNFTSINQQINEGSLSARVTQEGTDHWASIAQSGDNDTASVYQAGSGNRLETEQTFVQNHLTLSSIGQGNTVIVGQHGFATADIDQTGDANAIRLEQENYGLGSELAEVSQQGHGNQAEVQQISGHYAAGDVYLQQSGDLNLAQVRTTQTGHVSFTQSGTGNELDATSGGHGTSVQGRTVGDYNRVEVSQWNNELSLDIAQVGSENFISAQQGFQRHSGTIRQVGDHNQATLLQDSLSFADQGSIATIMQNGTGNVASVTQQ